jgi:DNA modification methylase
MSNQIQLISHIDHALVAQLHPPMYEIHKYWARKPDNVVAEYVEHYSRRGELVLDPFSGSGVTAIEALRLGRRAIGVDIDPVANFIAKMTALPVDLEKLQGAFGELETGVKPRILEYFETRCPKCGKRATIHFIVFLKDKPSKIAYDCDNENCKAHGLRDLTSFDHRRMGEIDKEDVPYWYPENDLVWNTRVNVQKGMKVSDLFSRRNLIALAILYDGINKTGKNDLRDMLRFAFSAALAQASKLLVYTKTSGPSWKVRGYWVPPNRYEMNVWRFFENRFKKVIHGKTQSNALLADKYSDNSFKILNHSATELSSISDLKNENCVDYVFTDPPYGDNVPYLELDLMWASWLGFKMNFDDEIIISDSPVRREKNFDLYYSMLSKTFREIYRVLKPSKFLTVTFNNTDMQIYNAIIRAVILAGFDLEKIIYQPPAVVSAKAQLAPYGSAYGDYYIRFRKPTQSRAIGGELPPQAETYERIVVETVKRKIAERGQPTPYSLIVNSYAEIYERLKNEGFLFAASESIDDILKRHVGREFMIVDDKWWFADPSVVPYIDRVPLAERVEKVVISTLNREVKASFNDILQQVYINFPNALTPEKESVQEILQKYAKKTKDRKWTLKRAIRERESQHNEVITWLVELGKKVGYDIHADILGYRRTSAVANTIDQSRAKEIDTLWLSDDKVVWSFEVENTTGITEGVVRGSNLTGSVNRVIVLPDERKVLLARKAKEPLIAEAAEAMNWGVVFYDKLWAYYEQNKRKRTISEKDFGRLIIPMKQFTKGDPSTDDTLHKYLRSDGEDSTLMRFIKGK